MSGINQAYATQLKYKFDEAIEGIAQQKKLDVVIDSSENQKIVIVGGIDVTNEVIQKLQ
jgi:Skp family chaperone for outer membrane proteins